MDGVHSEDQWALVSALSEPQRRSVYDAVCDQPDPATREQVAQAVGISRALAAFHLEKLVETGLLEASNRSSAGGRVPQIGRPAKRYRRSTRQVELSLPPRQYALAGQILALALDAADTGELPADAASRIAHERGRSLGENARSPSPAAHALPRAAEALAELGYAPVQHKDHITLSNCPFHDIVQVARHSTCQVNLALIAGILAGVGGCQQVTPVLDPQPGQCCVTLLAASNIQPPKAS